MLLDFQKRAVAAARVASLLTLAVGLAIQIGWFFNIPDLTSLYLSGPTVKTNAAIALTAASLANLMLISARGRVWLRVCGIVLAFIPFIIGALTLSEHVVGWDLGIDQLVMSEPSGAYGTISPNRMGPPASLSFVLLGLTMILTESRRRGIRRIGLAAGLAACAVPILPLLGYAYGISQLYAVARFTGISLSSALALLLLGAAVLAGRPQEGLAAMLTRPDEVGTLGRRLMPAALLLPFSLGWMFARLLEAGIIDGAFAISAMALVLTVVMARLIWRTGLRVSESLDARLAAERAMNETAKALRDADRQKSEFMATLSHELRNPLAPIRFALELLDSPPPAGQKARATIRRQVQHLTRLIDDLLDLTRITRNKLQLKVSRVELKGIIQDAADAVAGELARSGHTMDVQLPSEPVWLEVDPDRIVQIVTNLLNNAVRHTGSKDTIVVGAEANKRYVSIFVRDSGTGIDSADLERIFDSFVQVGEGRHGGLGIGLALVKGLAELHGGTVEARSEGLGKGAEFRVRLPRAEAPAVVDTDRAPAVEAVVPERVLVVDDNKDAADTLAAVLKARGHDVRVAYSGSEALKTAGVFQPTVGLLDIGMDGMNGYELAKALRRHVATSQALLVAITGWGQDDDRRRALASGFDAHLTKPADPDQIMTLIAERRPVADDVTKGISTAGAAPGPA